MQPPPQNNSSAPPLSLYAHFPWCVKKCPYCDFNSHAQRGDIDQDGYIDALLRDLDRDLARGGVVGDARARKLTSVFFGGGTPSLFGADAFIKLLKGLRARLSFSQDMEITLEANPGALEHDDFRAYREAGINRVSLGAQSFCDAQLRALGRIHSAADARRAIRAAHDANFTNINIDLMFALPQQRARDTLRDLDTALDFAPKHLSLYQLTIEPHTWFHRHPPTLPQDEQVMSMQRKLHARAAAHGYERYEISAHAKTGGECRHNLNYWQFGDYLALGAGAHGKITRDGKVTRYWKQKHPRQYLNALDKDTAAVNNEVIYENNATAGRATPSRKDILFEFLMNALRLREGFDAQLLTTRTGFNINDALTMLHDAHTRGLIKMESEQLRCSARGYLFLDEVLAGVLPE